MKRRPAARGSGKAYPPPPLPPPTRTLAATSSEGGGVYSTYDEFAELLQSSACCICYDTMDTPKHRPLVTSCGHIFGHQCYKEWMASFERIKSHAHYDLQSTPCPSCRAKVKDKSVRLVPLVTPKAAPVAAADLAIRQEEGQQPVEDEHRAILRSLRAAWRELSAKQRLLWTLYDPAGEDAQLRLRTHVSLPLPIHFTGVHHLGSDCFLGTRHAVSAAMRSSGNAVPGAAAAVGVISAGNTASSSGGTTAPGVSVFGFSKKRAELVDGVLVPVVGAVGGVVDVAVLALGEAGGRPASVTVLHTSGVVSLVYCTLDSGHSVIYGGNEQRNSATNTRHVVSPLVPSDAAAAASPAAAIHAALGAQFALPALALLAPIGGRPVSLVHAQSASAVMRFGSCVASFFHPSTGDSTVVYFRPDNGVLVHGTAVIPGRYVRLVQAADVGSRELLLIFAENSGSSAGDGGSGGSGAAATSASSYLWWWRCMRIRWTPLGSSSSSSSAIPRVSV